jgi:integrase
MPLGINMHPLEARVALKAMEAAVRGEPLSFTAADEPRPTEESRDTSAPRDNGTSYTLDQKKLDAALAEYAADKSHRRKELARRIAQRALSLPCTQSSAVAAISDWCKQELESGKRPSSVWTEASSVIALLKCVSGWHEFSVPKVGELKQLKGAGKARRDAKAPMPVSVLYKVLRDLPGHLPRDGGYWHAAFLLCALYGLRPREILQAGPGSLQSQVDVFGNEQLVFRVGINGAKNASSERDLPVPNELKSLFDLALSRGSCNSETARTRVDRLNGFVGKAQSSTATKHTLYSVRHLFADIARACGYSDSEFGPLMGHKSMSGITAVYGGAGSLDNERSIFASIRTKLFPDGLSSFLPIELSVQTDAPQI